MMTLVQNIACEKKIVPSFDWGQLQRRMGSGKRAI